MSQSIAQISFEDVQNGAIKIFSNVRNQITQSMIDAINASPTLLSQISRYSAQVGQGAFSIEVAAGAFYTWSSSVRVGNDWVPTGHRIGLDQYSFNGVSEFISTISHELGHWEHVLRYTRSRNQARDRGDEVALVATCLDAQGYAIVNNWIVQKELKESNIKISIRGDAEPPGTESGVVRSTLDLLDERLIDILPEFHPSLTFEEVRMQTLVTAASRLNRANIPSGQDPTRIEKQNNYIGYCSSEALKALQDRPNSPGPLPAPVDFTVMFWGGPEGVSNQTMTTLGPDGAPLYTDTFSTSATAADTRTVEYATAYGRDVVVVWTRTTGASFDETGSLSITTTAPDGTSDRYSVTGGAGYAVLGVDGSLTFDLGYGTATLDPATGSMATTLIETTISLAAIANPTISVDANGAVFFALGDAGLVAIGADGRVTWSIGNGLSVALPAGSEVAQNANGAFSVTTPSGAEAYIAAPNGTVVALPQGGTFELAPTTNDGLVARFGAGRSVTVDSQGGLSLGVDGLPSVELPQGGVNSLANFFEEQGLALDPVAAYVAATSGTGADAPSLPTSTVDIGAYNNWLDDREAADSAGQNGTNFAVVANPALLPLYDANVAAWNNASDEEILAHLNAMSKSGVAQQAADNPTLAEVWQNIATSLGMEDEPGGQTAGARLSGFVATGQAALGVISSLKSAIERPTIRNVAGATHQLVSLGIQLDDGLKDSVALALGATKYGPDEYGQLNQVVPDHQALQGLLAGAGAALSVIAAIENPTPGNVIGAGMNVYNAINVGNAIPGAGAIAAAIGFVENPSIEGGINTVVWTIAAVNPAFVPVAIAFSVISTVVSFFGGGKPIVLDMDGDGIVELTAVDASTAFYDLDGDGWREHRGWAGGGDGLLAIDANGDGFITGRDELSFLGYKEGARTDLEGLVAFDSNNDGKLSALDEHWGRFKVWIDADADGFSDAGELSTLAEAGLAEIGLAHTAAGTTGGGNEVFGYGEFKLADGTVRAFADAKLGTDSVIARSVPGAAAPLVFNLVGNAVHTIAAAAVMDYLLKPVLKAKDRVLTER
jgi:hypothetical protein